jgi:hypothetical protein
MTTPDFRALLQELVTSFEQNCSDYIVNPQFYPEVARARAALNAEPEGEGPTEPNVKAVRSGNFSDPGIWEIKP